MNRIFRFYVLLLLVILCAGVFTSCAKQTEQAAEPGVLSVYASNYPIFALADLITMDVPGVQLNCLTQPQDGCLRAYQISDWDYALLTRGCNIVIAGGRGLESYEALLYNLGETGPAVSCVLYGLDLKQVSAANTHPDKDSHWLDENPHIYMDFDGAMEITSRICETMKALDPENAEAYDQNHANAINRLQSLSEECQTMVSFAEGQPVIVMNEALVYLPRAYNLNMEICYERESGEDITGNDLVACIDTLLGCRSRVILIEKQAPSALCNALEAEGFIVIRLDVMSTRRSAEGCEGYFAAHRENAAALAAGFQRAI